MREPQILCLMGITTGIKFIYDIATIIRFNNERVTVIIVNWRSAIGIKFNYESIVIIFNYGSALGIEFNYKRL